MPKSQFISGLKEGDSVNSAFSIKYKHPPEAYKNGFRFELGLADRSGEIELKYWGSADKEKVEALYKGFKEGDVIEVNGKTSAFRGVSEIHINEGAGSIRKIAEFDIADFVEKSAEDSEKLANDMLAEIKGMKNEFLRKLMEEFFNDAKFMAQFRSAPAAMYMHHATIGGLIEHTSHVLKLCREICRIYPALDRDLLIAGAILHDIGKISEFRIGTNIKQTEEGMLRGHIAMGEEMVLGKIREIKDFPDELKIKIAHMLLSHHGANEYGSPQEPSFPEAAAVYYADEMDSKVDQFVKIKKETKTEDFRVYSKKLGRGIYLK